MTAAAVPAFRRQKRKNKPDRAFVELEGRRHYLGRFDDPAAKQQYHTLIAEWLANGRNMPVPHDELSMTTLCARFYRFAEGYYSQPKNWLPLIEMIGELYGETLAVDFGPRSLKTMRQRMIDEDWSRKYINENLHRVRRIFRWAAGEEMIPASVYEALKTVDALKKGRSEARENQPVLSVPDAHVDAIKPHVAAQVWAIIELQRLTGMRSGEAVAMRLKDLDTTQEPWVYRPVDHKMAHLGRKREIYLGKRARQAIEPFLTGRRMDAYLFSPIEAEAERRAAMRANRQSKVQPSQEDRSRENPRRKPGLRYTTQSYGRAVTRGIKAAFRPAGMTRSEFSQWKPPQHWHPHQLRHNYASMVRRDYGLEASQILLGHAKADVTQVYAERDVRKAIEVVRKIG